MNSKDIRNLYEAYASVYNEDLRNDLESESIDEDLSFIDDLNDNELDQVMENVLLDGEIDIVECVELLDYAILSEETEMERMHRIHNKRMKAKKSAERVERIKGSVKRVGQKLAAPARSAGTSVSTRVGQASKKVASATQKVKGFLGKVGRAAKAGASAAKKEFTGEAGKEAQAKYRERKAERSAAAKSAVGDAFKSGSKPSDPWKGSATKPTSRPSATTKSTKALSGTSVRAALPAGKDSERRAAAKAKLQKAAAGSSARGIRFAGPKAGQSAPQRAHTGVKGALEKFRKKAGLTSEQFDALLNYIFEDLVHEGYVNTPEDVFYILESLSESDVTEVVESYLFEEVETLDLYDVVLEHLIENGYADTEEAAEIIMVNMSEEWREEILEATGTYSVKAARAGKDIGKPGKQFEKIAKEAGKRYGSKERGEKVAGAVLAKLRAKKG
jgi:hypothetical protein